MRDSMTRLLVSGHWSALPEADLFPPLFDDEISPFFAQKHIPYQLQKLYIRYTQNKNKILKDTFVHKRLERRKILKGTHARKKDNPGNDSVR
jgi:hypothetical protein